MSNNQIKISREGCGKWLTAKSNANPIRLTKKSKTSKPINHLSLLTKCGPLPECSTAVQKIPANQSKMEKFLINAPEELQKLPHPNSKVELIIPSSSWECCSSLTRDDEYELWGSEDESEDHSLGPQMKYRGTSRANDENVSPMVSNQPQTTSNASLVTRPYKHRGGCHENNHLFVQSKKVKTCGDNLFKSETEKNDVLFTQWLQDQVDEFCRNPCEKTKTNLLNRILSSVRQLPVHTQSPVTEIQNSHSLEESTFLGKFSQWLDQHVETVHLNKDDKKVSSGEICQQGFEFSQWFDNALETFVNHNENMQ